MMGVLALDTSKTPDRSTMIDVEALDVSKTPVCGRSTIGAGDVPVGMVDDAAVLIAVITSVVPLTVFTSSMLCREAKINYFYRNHDGQTAQVRAKKHARAGGYAVTLLRCYAVTQLRE
jgi:hypothetical protein